MSFIYHRTDTALPALPDSVKCDEWDPASSLLMATKHTKAMSRIHFDKYTHTLQDWHARNPRAPWASSVGGGIRPQHHWRTTSSISRQKRHLFIVKFCPQFYRACVDRQNFRKILINETKRITLLIIPVCMAII